MSAQHFFDTAPLGALIRYSDGQPKPPIRFNKKLASWERSNGVGRLIAKHPAVERASYSSVAGFALHHGDFGSGGVIVMVVTVMYDVTSRLQFEIIERPKPGMVQVITRWNGTDELKYLAPNMAAAEAWLANNRYSNAILDVVSEDKDVGTMAASVIGRPA